MNSRQRGIALVILIVVIGLPLSKLLVHILTESWWFDAVSFSEVFWTRLTWQILAWVATFGLYTLFLWGNYQIAMRWAGEETFRFFEDSKLGAYAETFSNYLASGAIFLISVIAATVSASDWETILKYLHPTDFGSRDPIFQQDISFYIFSLPLYEDVRNWLLVLFVSGLALSTLVYTLKGKITLEWGWGNILMGKVKTHVSLLLASISALIAWGFWLERYQMLYAPGGVVFGAGYTDVHAQLFAYQMMSFLALAVAVLFVFSIWQSDATLPIFGIGLFLITSVLVNGIYPWFQQQFIVDPNELAKEKPYLENNIQFTQAAYRLKDVQRQSFAAEAQLNRQVLQENQPTIRNIRLWDYRPLLATYRKIFPHLFEPNTAIPAEVRAHFRYPLDLFKIQAQMYLSYHMTDPEAFYNREDLWRFPIQTYEGSEQTMQPYYVVMRLPGEAKAGFILILPFTPANKDNMIAWMAARSNGKDYGKLLLYEFSKRKLVYGPRQIEARIDQDTQISQQFTLWSQAGSKVIRGDLLVIPIQESLLYVEPVYLRAEQGELPELKRIIVSYGKAVVMEETLEKSLAAIFGGVPAEKSVLSPVTGKILTLVQSALETYQKAAAAARQGNWADYGRYQQELENILQKLNQGSKP